MASTTVPPPLWGAVSCSPREHSYHLPTLITATSTKQLWVEPAGSGASFSPISPFSLMRPKQPSRVGPASTAPLLVLKDWDQQLTKSMDRPGCV